MPNAIVHRIKEGAAGEENEEKFRIKIFYLELQMNLFLAHREIYCMSHRVALLFFHLVESPWKGDGSIKPLGTTERECSRF